MFAVTGKIYSIDKVEFNNKSYLRMVIKKKKNDKEIVMCFLIFKDAVIDQYKKRLYGMGDYVETKFFIKANEHKDRYYNNLFVDKITILRKAKKNTMNMFEQTDSSLSDFE
jgi:hypothetical protein